MKKKNEGRKPVPRTLPGIEQACANFTGFAEGENRSKRIFEILIGVIQHFRRTVPQPFYAMREVAEYFDVSLTTVAMIYRHLNREGALTLIRGSQSMIPPRSLQPRLAVRGVVCMPIWMPGFLRFMDWRTRFSQLEEELSRHRFVLQPIFYKQGEDAGPAFVERVLKFNPDYVLWEAPTRSDQMTVQGLIDAGISILTIVGLKEPSRGRVYQQSYARALRQGLKAWEADDGINHIVIPQNSISPSAVIPNIMTVLAESTLPHRFELWYRNKTPLAEYVRRLASDHRAGIIFNSDLFFTRICALVPEEMLNLFRRNRVMVMRRVSIPSLAWPAGLTVDALLFPDRRLARKIAEELNRGEGLLPGEGGTFEAEWRPRLPLAEIAQTDFNE